MNGKGAGILAIRAHRAWHQIFPAVHELETSFMAPGPGFRDAGPGVAGFDRFALEELNPLEFALLLHKPARLQPEQQTGEPWVLPPSIPEQTVSRWPQGSKRKFLSVVSMSARGPGCSFLEAREIESPAPDGWTRQRQILNIRSKTKTTQDAKSLSII